MWFHRKKIDDEQWEVLNKEVMRLTREEKLDEALAQGTELFELGKKCFGEKHGNTATALNNLGIIHTLRRDFDEAESCLLAALQISEKVSGRISSAVAIVNMNLARLYTFKAQMINDTLAACKEQRT